ncbi:unnamed protein product [Onchocerca flexuosa]|uniref:GRB2-associated-binding protein 2 n=1 Tax=Onchocerca flexuosa TaxID=387005 RepID=A0A183H7D2_9BILA|nr:unnamed protein product [Onchocerca flexuosa]
MPSENTLERWFCEGQTFSGIVREGGQGSTDYSSVTLEENDELCGNQNQWNSSSPLHPPTAISNTYFYSATKIRPVSSNFNRSISSGTATNPGTNLTDYEPSNSSSVNPSQNSDSRLFHSNPVIFSEPSSYSAIVNQRTSKSVSTIPHPTIPPPPPPSLKLLSSVLRSPPTLPLLQSGEIRNDNSSLSLPLPPVGTKVGTTIAPGHLTFDIPDLPAIDSEDTENNSHINPEISHNTAANTANITDYLNNTDRNCLTVVS